MLLNIRPHTFAEFAVFNPLTPNILKASVLKLKWMLIKVVLPKLSLVWFNAFDTTIALSLVSIWSLTIAGSLESLKRGIAHDRRPSGAIAEKCFHIIADDRWRSPDRWKSLTIVSDHRKLGFTESQITVLDYRQIKNKLGGTRKETE